MLVARLAGPRRIETVEAEPPALPHDGLLLSVRACGICGSDLRRWRSGPDAAGLVTGGHEISGVVIAVGQDIERHNVGDRLAVAPDIHCGRCDQCSRGRYNLCDDLRLIGITPGYEGGLAERMVLTAEMLRGGVVHRIPAGVGFRAAALAEPLSSVLACHEAAGTTLGDTVVIMGAGPIGCLHTAVAHLRGATVVLSEPSAERRRMAARFHPELIVDPGAQDLGVEIGRTTDGRGADIVICANPVAASQTQAVEVVRKGGTIVLFGGLPKDDPMTVLDANRIHYGEIRVMGSFSYHPSFHALALRTLQRGLIDSDAVISHTYPLAETSSAFDMAAGGEALKVIVEMPGSDAPGEGGRP